MKKKNTILVAPLHWGLGHATRCIPIITSLTDHGYNVIIGSDGAALLLLQKEFPHISSIVLPSYNISYPKKGKLFKWNMLLKLPGIRQTMAAEKKIVQKLVAKDSIQGIISDNRLGVYDKSVPSVFITHQLQVLSGNTTALSSKMHQHIISKYHQCWVPDVDATVNLSGKLGHLPHSDLPIQYIGILSRMKPKKLPLVYDVLCLISGPEPQRSLFEEKLTAAFKATDKNIAVVRGVVEKTPTRYTKNNVTYFNYLESASLEKIINESAVVVSRSGYTTIMDLAMLQKPAFFIPTPGQYEQEYLAQRLAEHNMVPSCNQEEFTEQILDTVAQFSGLPQVSTAKDYAPLFSLFDSK